MAVDMVGDEEGVGSGLVDVVILVELSISRSRIMVRDDVLRWVCYETDSGIESISNCYLSPR